MKEECLIWERNRLYRQPPPLSSWCLSNLGFSNWKIQAICPKIDFVAHKGEKDGCVLLSRLCTAQFQRWHLHYHHGNLMVILASPLPKSFALYLVQKSGRGLVIRGMQTSTFDSLVSSFLIWSKGVKMDNHYGSLFYKKGPMNLIIFWNPGDQKLIYPNICS